MRHDKDRLYDLMKNEDETAKMAAKSLDIAKGFLCGM